MFTEKDNLSENEIWGQIITLAIFVFLAVLC